MSVLRGRCLLLRQLLLMRPPLLQQPLQNLWPLHVEDIIVSIARLYPTLLMVALDDPIDVAYRVLACQMSDLLPLQVVRLVKFEGAASELSVGVGVRVNDWCAAGWCCNLCHWDIQRRTRDIRWALVILGSGVGHILVSVVARL